MKCKPLKDVAQIIMGQSPDSSSYNEVGEGFPFFQGNADFGVMYPSERIWCNQPKKIANENDILISVRAPIGALNYANKKCCIGRGLAAITVNNPVERNYIFHLLKAKNAELNRKGTGSTFKAIGKNVLEDIPVPIVSSEIQLHITRLMDITESIISKRKNELKYYDELIKARFVEMFGNPEVICKDWIEKPLGELCEKVIRYPTFYGMEYLESGTRVIRIGNILEDGHMDVEDNNYVFVYNGVNNDFPETVIEINDIIMAVRGDGSAAKRIGIIRENKLVGANISPNLIRIKANHNIDPIYLFSFLTGEVGQKRLGAYVNKTAKKNIAAKDIVKVFVPTPPIEKQREYASFVAQVDKSKVMKRLRLSTNSFC